MNAKRLKMFGAVLLCGGMVGCLGGAAVDSLVSSAVASVLSFLGFVLFVAGRVSE